MSESENEQRNWRQVVNQHGAPRRVWVFSEANESHIRRPLEEWYQKVMFAIPQEFRETVELGCHSGQHHGIEMYVHYNRPSTPEELAQDAARRSETPGDRLARWRSWVKKSEAKDTEAE
jgi:hypothetical protein